MEVEERTRQLERGVRLEWLTIAWNLVEGGVAVPAALAASSVALLGVGIDSFAESASGLVLLGRLTTERGDREAAERVERRALRLVALLLFSLAAYVATDAGSVLLRARRPEATRVGMAVTAVSLAVMWWLARAKKQTARALGSRAMQADAFQTTACFWLSLIALVGIALNAALGWWWADPVAALGMTYFIAREGLEAWRGEECCDPQ